MTNSSDWKDDEKLETALRSLVASSLKHKEIFGFIIRFHNWFHHNYMINLFYQNLTFSFGSKQLFR